MSARIPITFEVERNGRTARLSVDINASVPMADGTSVTAFQIMDGDELAVGRVVREVGDD